MPRESAALFPFLTASMAGGEAPKPWEGCRAENLLVCMPQRIDHIQGALGSTIRMSLKQRRAWRQLRGQHNYRTSLAADRKTMGVLE